MDYTNNSNRSRDDDEKKVEKVVTGEVVMQKKSSGRKFLETFFVEDLKSIKDYIVSDIIIPYAKNILSDAFNTMLYGSSGRGARPTGTNQRTSYQRYYDEKRSRPSSAPIANNDTYDVDNMIFRNYVDADKVLDGLRDICREYDMASVGDLKMLLGEGTIPNDYSWGWENLDNATIARTRDGYIIRLPKTQRIK